MSKARINILIVEDDPAQGRALFEAFKRAGYSVHLSETSVGGLTQATRVEYHAMIVDCMLPKMNGVDLVEEIQNMIPHKPKVFLMTGIYKDRKFIQDAMKRTSAETFFIKPLNLEEILAQVDTVLAHMVVPEKPPILNLYSNNPPAADSLIQLIEVEPTLHAFHLPKLYQRFQQAKVNGELTLISAVGEVSSVSFHDGKIFAVKTPDKESFFGGLAISKGFVTPEDVLEAVKDTRPKMLGQKLIDSMALSPHAIDIILEEQLALRLSQTIQDDVVSLQWMNKKFTRPAHTLLPERFYGLQEDWLNSKVTPDWIHSTLMVWGSFEIGGEYHTKLRGGHSLEALLKHPDFDPNTDLQYLFSALIHSRCHIGLRIETAQDFSFLESRLDRMTADFKQQNYFQFLGVGEKAHQREITKAFESLKDSFDPVKLPAHCPADIQAKCTRVFLLISKAHETLSSDIERPRYISGLQSKRQQEALEAEPIFRSAIIELQTGHAKQAAQKLQMLLDRKLEFRDLRSYRVWAGLKLDRNYNSIRLDQIPPEERHSAPYMMAKGVHHKIMHQYKKALEAFRTAHILDARLNIAKHELQRLMQDLERGGPQHREMLKEVTSVVENLFGKVSNRAPRKSG